MAGTAHYLIRGGIEGRERLRILSRVLRPSTIALLERAGLGPGMAAWDAGCGGGDVAFDMACMVGPGGSVMGTDIDEAKLSIAREEAEAHHGLENVIFHRGDLMQEAPEVLFDFVHARFLLTHLSDPAAALARLKQSLRPGGMLAIEDIDFRGYFCEPPNAAFERYVELYARTCERRGGDANIGPRLPALLTGAGFEDVQMDVVQHASLTGEVKLLTPLTMENIAEAVVAEGLADRSEVDRLVAELYRFVDTPGTIGSTPRIFEVWARRPLA